ncbi:MAG: 4'-phosphopantetheinyl transferase superfamily protein [Ruminococcaceae bacterium]|nr:4'-phosphopantetheinyl transferase superfamily protein [Oscillospiraceae bacterium]
MDKTIDFTACIAAGGDGLRPRIEQARQLYSEMSEEYFLRILAKKGRAFNESACGFLLADSLLTKHGIDKSELVISRNADGRPCIINRTDIDFSISHSEGAVLCSLCIGDDIRTGCDVQHVRYYSPDKMAQLAEIFMNANDYTQYLKTQDESLFYTIWTRREAYIKYAGRDVFQDLRNIRFQSADYHTGVIISCGKRYYYSVYSDHKENI